MQRATAEDILPRYATGERHFARLDLQGADFRGANLANADFSECDLRGTRFDRANLAGARFCGARAGLQPLWAIALVVVAALLAGAFAFVAATFAAVLSFYVFDPNSVATRPERIAYGCVIVTTYLTFAIVSVRKGIVAAFGALVLAGTAALIGTLVGAEAETGAGAVAVAIVVAAAGAGAVAMAVAAAGATAGTNAAAGTAAIALAGAVSVAAGGATAIAAIGEGAVAGAVAGAAPMTLLGAYIGWRTLKNDPCDPCRDPWFRDLALSIPASLGTRFYQANLANADFAGAYLRNANFHKASLRYANFRNARRLHLARPGNSYLKDLPVLNLLVIGTLLAEKSFDRLDLRGIDLSGLDLSDASFIATDLSQANLSNANLTRAKLVQTQLAAADLRGAIFTGATIESWQLSPDTCLTDIHCDYVFRRLLPEKRPAFLAPANDNSQDRQRQPDEWHRKFAPGEFAAAMTPLPKTLDLYHEQVSDLRTIALALQKLCDDNPNAQLAPIAFEFRGEANRDVLVKVTTAPTADCSDLYRQYFQIHDALKSLPAEKLQALFLAAGARQRQLVTLLSTAIAPPQKRSEGP